MRYERIFVTTAHQIHFRIIQALRPLNQVIIPTRSALNIGLARLNSTRTTIDVGLGSPTLVLIHGFCCHATDWQWHIDAFSKTNRVIAPTLRGHEDDNTAVEDLTIEGLAQDVVALLKEHNITDAVLCGHSMGTRVVLEAHHQAPDRVTGVILVDGSNTVIDGLDTTLDTFDNINDKKKWAQGLFKQMFLPDTFAKEQAIYRNRINNMPVDKLSTIYRQMIIWDGTKLSDRLTRLDGKPMLVLQSTIRDNTGFRRWLKPGETSEFVNMLATATPKTSIITYPERGHFIHLDEPEKILSDISTWITANALAR